MGLVGIPMLGIRGEVAPDNLSFGGLWQPKEEGRILVLNRRV